MRSNEALGTYLLSVTVQIRHSKLDRPVGTGVIVSTEGVIATCKHVLEQAGVSSTGFALQSWPRFLLRSVKVKGEVGIHFPKVGDRAAANRRAIVLGRLDQYDDDIVLLKLTEAPPYLGPESVAVLGRAEASFGCSIRGT